MTTYSLKTLRWNAFLWLMLLAALSFQASASDRDFKRLEMLSAQAEAQGEIQKAIEVSQKMLTMRPGDVPTMLALSGLYGKADRPDLQIQWARRVLKAQPNHFAALINLGNGLAVTGDIPGAKTSYAQAKVINPKSPLVPYSSGVLAQSQGLEHEAISHFQAALKMDPEFEDALFNIAVAHANLGNTKPAIEYLDRLLARHPGDLDAKQLRLQILKSQ